MATENVIPSPQQSSDTHHSLTGYATTEQRLEMARTANFEIYGLAKAMRQLWDDDSGTRDAVLRGMLARTLGLSDIVYEMVINTEDQVPEDRVREVHRFLGIEVTRG